MINGMWWLIILLIVVAVLWFWAQSRGATGSHPKNLQKGSQQARKSQQGPPKKPASPKVPVNDALQKTATFIKKNFPDYHVTRKSSHLLITKQNEKIAMITIDKKVAVGQRRLGDVPVINYHYKPSHAQLSAHLDHTQ